MRVHPDPEHQRPKQHTHAHICPQIVKRTGKVGTYYFTLASWGPKCGPSGDNTPAISWTLPQKGVEIKKAT